MKVPPRVRQWRAVWMQGAAPVASIVMVAPWGERLEALRMEVAWVWGSFCSGSIRAVCVAA